MSIFNLFKKSNEEPIIQSYNDVRNSNNKVTICSICDQKNLAYTYVLLNSVKKYKEESTNVEYLLFIDQLNNKHKQYFSDLISKDFNILFFNTSIYKKNINPPVMSYLYYFRCLLPNIFPKLNKLLYFDIDMIVINKGFEYLWNIDLRNKYAAVAIDIQVEYGEQFEKKNVRKRENYFNSGVMTLNLKQIRKDGLDKRIKIWLSRWNTEIMKCHLFDQTLLNFLFRDNIIIIDPKYNCSILQIRRGDYSNYVQFYGTNNLVPISQQSIILHFKGQKPWKNMSRSYVFRAVSQATYFKYFYELKKK